MKNTQVDNAKELDFVMPMYILAEYIGNSAKASESFWKYHRDVPDATLTDSESFKVKARITGSTPANGININPKDQSRHKTNS